MTISMDKKYCTRDGHEVRLYATDGGGGRESIHGAVLTGDGWKSLTWGEDGIFIRGENHPADLIEVKPRREGWINLYAGDGSDRFVAYTSDVLESKEAADAYAGTGSSRIACVRIEWE